MWEPIIQHGSLSDRIAAQVERLISDERLKPGDQLPSERDMAHLLGVSRPSLREAVRILEVRGRLVVKHGQGVFIQAPRSERELRAALGDTELSLKELYAMREVLEVPAAAWAAENITAEQLHEVRAALDKVRAAGEAPTVDYDELRQLDADFHLAIAVAAGNRFLKQTSSVLHNMVVSGMETTLQIPGRIEIAREDHERIYTALAEHDVAGARRAARAHIRGAHAAAVRRVDQEAKVTPAQAPAADSLKRHR
jgi:GntR family transcriptional regulator, transcriptional repressor for pyruvate dehydrogenase complex